nr:MAG TPA: hypothetical protein [Caudoviricetes sp.]
MRPQASSKQKAVYSSSKFRSSDGRRLNLFASFIRLIIRGLRTKVVQGPNSSLRVVEQEHVLLISQLHACLTQLLVGRLYEASLADDIQDREDILESLRLLLVHTSAGEQIVRSEQERVRDFVGLGQGQHRGPLDTGHKRLVLREGRELDNLTGCVLSQLVKGSDFLFHDLGPPLGLGSDSGLASLDSPVGRVNLYDHNLLAGGGGDVRGTIPLSVARAGVADLLIGGQGNTGASLIDIGVLPTLGRSDSHPGIAGTGASHRLNSQRPQSASGKLIHIGDDIGGLSGLGGGVDSVLRSTERTVLRAQSHRGALAVGVGNLLVPSDEASSIVDGGVGVQGEGSTLLSRASDRRSVGSHTVAHILVGGTAVVVVRPVLDDTTLEDFDQLGIEHVVGEGNLVAGESGHSRLLSTQNALDHQLYGVLFVDLRLNGNLAGSVEGQLITVSDLSGYQSNVDGRNFMTLLDSHKSFSSLYDFPVVSILDAYHVGLDRLVVEGRSLRIGRHNHRDHATHRSLDLLHKFSERAEVVLRHIAHDVVVSHCTREASDFRGSGILHHHIGGGALPDLLGREVDLEAPILEKDINVLDTGVLSHTIPTFPGAPGSPP